MIREPNAWKLLLMFYGYLTLCVLALAAVLAYAN